MNWGKIKKVLGPGILFASTAIGVSHLVQSTRAGANFGFMLLWAVLAANIFKYPFFEYGSRYANATGESIKDGYKKLGKPVLWAYFFITLASMFFVAAAVGFVTGGFMDNLFGVSTFIEWKLAAPALVFTICIGLLLIGKFNFLDSIIKVIGIVLVTSTLLAFILALINGPVEKSASFVPPDILDDAGILFIIALMGWMPTALDLSTWNSLWTVEKIKSSGYYPTLKETLFDFNLGYWITTGLSVCFITLGAYLMYGTGVSMPAGSAGFANKVIELYTSTIGDWSYLIIATAAFSIMFGTSLGVFDGYARSLERTSELLFLSDEDAKAALDSKKIYRISLIIVGLGGFSILAFFMGQFKTLIDLATTISFLIAPFVAIANLKLVTNKYVKQEAVPPFWMLMLSFAGIVFLAGFALLFVYTKLT